MQQSEEAGRSAIGRAGEVGARARRAGAVGDGAGGSAVLLALGLGDVTLAKELASARERDGGVLTALECASLGWASALAVALVRAPGSVDRAGPDGFAPVHAACLAGSARCVRLLVEAGADVDQPSENHLSETPLHSAVRADAGACAAELVSAGADRRFVNALGLTPVQLAVRLQHADAGMVIAGA